MAAVNTRRTCNVYIFSSADITVILLFVEQTVMFTCSVCLLERPQGAPSLVDSHAEVRPPSLLPQPQDPWTELAHPRGNDNRLQIEMDSQTWVRLHDEVMVPVCWLLCPAPELYVWLPRRRLGQAACRRDGQTALRWRVRNKRNGLPGQNFTSLSSVFYLSFFTFFILVVLFVVSNWLTCKCGFLRPVQSRRGGGGPHPVGWAGAFGWRILWGRGGGRERWREARWNWILHASRQVLNVNDHQDLHEDRSKTMWLGSCEAAVK